MSLPEPSGAAPCIDGSWKNVACQLISVKNKVEESDEEPFTVPDVEARPSESIKASEDRQVNGRGVAAKRKRGRNTVDREYKRLKRLLRNRVSAQQARERKKVYANELESRAKDLQDRNSVLEEKISTLINKNTMLRKVIMNTRPKLMRVPKFKMISRAKADEDYQIINGFSLMTLLRIFAQLSPFITPCASKPNEKQRLLSYDELQLKTRIP